MTPAKRPRRRTPTPHADSIGAPCHYCERPMVRLAGQRFPTREHLTPLSRGGLDTPDNVAIACARCNNEKGNLTEKEYRRWLTMRQRVRLADYRRVVLAHAASTPS